VSTGGFFSSLLDPRYFRPTEVDELLGDSTKARTQLGWHHKTSFKELVAEMVDSDLAQLRLSNSSDCNGRPGNGF